MSKLGGALRRFLPATLHWRSLAGVSSLLGAPPAAMVPLSVLESVQATLAAQLADLRADAKAAIADAKAAMADTKATLVDTKAALVDAKAALVDAKAEAKADLADAKAEAKAAMATQRDDAAASLKKELDFSQQLSAASYQALQLSGQHALAAANHAADVATGRVNARVLAEESLAVIWRQWSELTDKEKIMLGVTKQPNTATQQMESLLKFSGVAAILQVAEEDNMLSNGVLKKSAATLYPTLCNPMHTRRGGRGYRTLPVEVFGSAGDNGIIAFAALVALSGRNVGLYLPEGKTVAVTLRALPPNMLTATVEQIKRCPKYQVVASLDTGGDKYVTPPEVQQQPESGGPV